jgi:NAD(P)-dependent dehydrogenase (short-subunit alcohol dehydrogenase family)
MKLQGLALVLALVAALNARAVSINSYIDSHTGFPTLLCSSCLSSSLPLYLKMGASGTKYVSDSDLAKDLTGKTVIVTGGNSGIGKSTCIQLCKQGATVIIGCRRLASGEEVAEECNGQPDNKGTAKAMVLDIADVRSIKSFVEAFTKECGALDILVNNAGIMNVPSKELTKDGYEAQFGTNHMGHFALTGLLLPVLKKSAKPRVVCLSSAFHDDAMGKKGAIDFEDVNGETRAYDGWTAYAQSKLANLLFAREMARRHPAVTTVSLHPGFVESNLMKMNAVGLMLISPILTYGMGRINPWDGVQTSLHACLSDDLENGRYYAQVGSPRGVVGGWPTQPKDMSDQVTDDNAQKLWELSVKLSKIDY